MAGPTQGKEGKQMKQHKQLSRRVLSVSLSAALALGMISPAALAAAPADTLYVSVSGSDANDGTQESPLATLPAAYDAVNDGGTIILLSDLETDIVTEFAEEKSVTLDGGGYSVTYTSSTSISTEAAGVFSVSAGTVSLTNITVQMPEQKGTNGRVLYIGEGGAVELLDGAVLANGYLGYGGGGVLVDGGSLTMTEGAEIQDCYIVNRRTDYYQPIPASLQLHDALRPPCRAHGCPLCNRRSPAPGRSPSYHHEAPGHG